VAELSVSAWIATAGVGMSLLWIWIGRGALRERETGRRRLRWQLVFSHVALAVTGLALWVAYLVTDDDVLAWITLGALVVVATLGTTSYYIWQKRRLGRFKATKASWDVPASVIATGDIPPEQYVPISVVLLHGLFAVTTVVLVALTVLGIPDVHDVQALFGG
jgi:hypothetical protein